MTEKRIDAFGFMKCAACGGELHPIRPGSTAPEYYCPTTGRTREVREGDEIVAMMRKSDLPAAGGKADSPGTAGKIFAAVFWLVVIAGGIYLAGSCFQ